MFAPRGTSDRRLKGDSAWILLKSSVPSKLLAAPTLESGASHANTNIGGSGVLKLVSTHTSASTRSGL